MAKPDDMIEVEINDCCYNCAHLFYGQGGDVSGLAMCLRDIPDANYDMSDECLDRATYVFDLKFEEDQVGLFTLKCRYWKRE